MRRSKESATILTLGDHFRRMSTLQELRGMVESMGLRGADALKFIKEQQELAREIRQSKLEEAARQRSLELELARP